MRDKLAGIIQNTSVEFARAAQLVEGRHIALVERHRKARLELVTAQRTRADNEVLQRAKRFRKGLLGLWDRVTGKHAELRRRKEMEAATCAECEAAEKQGLIQGQLQERQRLQEDIRQQLQAATRIHRDMACTGRQAQAENRLMIEIVLSNAKIRCYEGAIGCDVREFECATPLCWSNLA